MGTRQRPKAIAERWVLPAGLPSVWRGMRRMRIIGDDADDRARRWRLCWRRRHARGRGTHGTSEGRGRCDFWRWAIPTPSARAWRRRSGGPCGWRRCCASAASPSADPEIIARTGWTTDELSAAIDEADPRGPYALVSLLIGVNNQYRGRDAEEYRAQFADLLRRAVGFAGGDASRVVVLSIPDWSVTPFADGRDRPRIAAEIDAYNADRPRGNRPRRRPLRGRDARRPARPAPIPPCSSGDGLHPSGRSYAEWAALALPAAVEVLGRTLAADPDRGELPQVNEVFNSRSTDAVRAKRASVRMRGGGANGQGRRSEDARRDARSRCSSEARSQRVRRAAADPAAPHAAGMLRDLCRLVPRHPGAMLGEHAPSPRTMAVLAGVGLFAGAVGMLIEMIESRSSAGGKDDADRWSTISRTGCSAPEQARSPGPSVGRCSLAVATGAVCGPQPRVPSTPCACWPVLRTCRSAWRSGRLLLSSIFGVSRARGGCGRDCRPGSWRGDHRLLPSGRTLTLVPMFPIRHPGPATAWIQRLHADIAMLRGAVPNRAPVRLIQRDRAGRGERQRPGRWRASSPSWRSRRACGARSARTDFQRWIRTERAPPDARPAGLRSSIASRRISRRLAVRLHDLDLGRCRCASSAA